MARLRASTAVVSSGTSATSHSCSASVLGSWGRAVRCPAPPVSTTGLSIVPSSSGNSDSATPSGSVEWLDLDFAGGLARWQPARRGSRPRAQSATAPPTQLPVRALPAPRTTPRATDTAGPDRGARARTKTSWRRASSVGVSASVQRSNAGMVPGDQSTARERVEREHRQRVLVGTGIPGAAGGPLGRRERHAHRRLQLQALERRSNPHARQHATVLGDEDVPRMDGTVPDTRVVRGLQAGCHRAQPRQRGLERLASVAQPAFDARGIQDRRRQVDAFVADADFGDGQQRGDAAARAWRACSSRSDQRAGIIGDVGDRA